MDGVKLSAKQDDDPAWAQNSALEYGKDLHAWIQFDVQNDGLTFSSSRFNTISDASEEPTFRYIITCYTTDEATVHDVVNFLVGNDGLKSIQMTKNGGNSVILPNGHNINHDIGFESKGVMNLPPSLPPPPFDPPPPPSAPPPCLDTSQMTHIFNDGIIDQNDNTVKLNDGCWELKPYGLLDECDGSTYYDGWNTTTERDDMIAAGWHGGGNQGYYACVPNGATKCKTSSTVLVDCPTTTPLQPSSSSKTVAALIAVLAFVAVSVVAAWTLLRHLSQGEGRVARTLHRVDVATLVRATQPLKLRAASWTTTSATPARGEGSVWFPAAVRTRAVVQHSSQEIPSKHRQQRVSSSSAYYKGTRV